jgi:SAM-dependent methyltransferase
MLLSSMIPPDVIPDGTPPDVTPDGAMPDGATPDGAMSDGAMSDVTPYRAMFAIRDRYLAPSLLAPFADDMAHRLSRISMGPLLETCADTGVLTQAIASAMSAGLTIIATDPSAEAIACASRKPGLARVNWQQAEPTALPFPIATFGIVACHFGIVAIPDRVRAFEEARRVMKPGGRFVFSVPGNIRHNMFAYCLQEALKILFPADPPGFAARVLHGYAEPETIDDDLTEAGFTDATYTVVDLPYAAASARDAATGYCLGTALRAEIEARAPGEAEQVTREVAAILEAHFGTGPITTSMRAHIISASG